MIDCICPILMQFCTSVHQRGRLQMVHSYEEQGLQEKTALSIGIICRSLNWIRNYAVEFCSFVGGEKRHSN